MNIPLLWLADYITVPKNTKELTDRLTMIGHMLDKIHGAGDQTVLDLELRGNRSDLFGIYGIARDISAAFHIPLKSTMKTALPKTDSTSTLVTVEAKDLVERFLACKLQVTIGPSPEWIVKRLALYGLPSINNVVDITNFVMIETGEPMHAFDAKQIKQEKLILRRAKKNEQFVTLQGTQVTLTPDDLVIADAAHVHGLTMIGGKESGVQKGTREIILEAAVYNQANVRRSARRLNIRTEAGTRHEKLLDPEQVRYALERAYYLLVTHAQAKSLGPIADFYPKPVKPLTIAVKIQDIERLTGLHVTTADIKNHLTQLGCEVQEKQDILQVKVPTWRTDIHESADIIEEIARLVGYEHIPLRHLSGNIPEQTDFPQVVQEEHIRDALITMQCHEVITPSFMSNDLLTVYEQNGTFPTPIRLINAPDPDIATLRPSSIPNLVSYAKRSIGFRQKRIALFEIGRRYEQKKKQYKEERILTILIGGETDTASWNRTPRALTLYDLTGLLTEFYEYIGTPIEIKPSSNHPSLDTQIQGQLFFGTICIGTFGQIHQAIVNAERLTVPLFVTELSLDILLTLPKQDIQPYRLAPAYPPIIEDISCIVSDDSHLGDMLQTLAKLHPLLTDIQLVGTYQNKRTIRLTFSHPEHTIKNEDVKPVREKIIATIEKTFHAQVPKE